MKFGVRMRENATASENAFRIIVYTLSEVEVSLGTDMERRTCVY